jgi:acetyl/propionyl-CoA carboxylase alpha subunit/acetyl-CoA carboxylase carboxyltransferase component
MAPEFRRLAVVNRAEPAMRLVRAARDLEHERALGLRTIALYTDPDARALFVREADEAVALGPVFSVEPASGRRTCAYLDHERLERALLDARADAVWAGWGFVSEQAEFVERLERLGIVFVGPPASAMRLCSDKVAAKRLAESAGVPVVPWSRGPVESVEAALLCAATIGYPVMLKAAGGGGGRGIRLVTSVEQMAEAFARARDEARGAFGDPSVFLERALANVRHVEVQVLGDRHGTLWAVGVRDCTIQRRHQKVLEEAPATALAPEEEQALREAAVRVARAARYESAGTVEFLFDPSSRACFFMEVNARLQVEHTVTEATTGLDLVKLQLRLALGGRLEGEPPATQGHAIEVRLNAEDPEAGFAPAPGRFELLRLPAGPGIRVDCGAVEGETVAPEFDSMVAKLVAHGRTREEALARLRRALQETVVVVQGGATNRAFLLDLARHPDVRANAVDTGWLERVTAVEAAATKPHADVALVQAAIDLFESERSLEQAAFYASAARLRPESRGEVGRSVEFRQDGQSYRVRVSRLDRGAYRCELDGRSVEVAVDELGRYERMLCLGGRRFRVVSVVQGHEHVVEVDGVPQRFSRDDLGVVRSPSPAVVVRVRVKPGEVVRAGESLVVLEAMKLETSVCAPFAGRVRRVLVSANAQVATGAALVQLDPEACEERGHAGRIELSPAGDGPPAGHEAVLRDARRLALGYDVDAGHARRLAADYAASCEAAGREPDAAAEDGLLELFADTAALFRRQMATDAALPFEHVSSGEYVLTYLRGLDADDPGLPPSFLDRLRRALAHHGIASLERSPELLDALHRVWRSRQQAELLLPLLHAILERRLAAARSTGEADPGFARTLERLIDAVLGRHPSLADVARDVRYRMYERPAYERTRRRAYEEAEAQLDVLRRDPGGPDRERRVAALVACPQPLVSFLGARLDAESPAMRQLMGEVIARRYYRIRRLERVSGWQAEGCSGVSAEYEQDGRRVRLLATCCADGQLEACVAVLAGQADARDELDVAVEVYAWRPGPLGTAEANAECARAALARATAGFSRRPSRVVLVVAGPESGFGLSGVQHFTFVPEDGGYREERVFRGFHPLIGERLRVTRLESFEIERLPSVEDVFLFHARARENPRDERLFAFAEVRDATPVRDERGRVVQIPHLERMFLESGAAMRAYQARRPPEQRLHWNQIHLDVWPPLDVPIEDLAEMARRCAHYTAGLGLEKVLMRADLRVAGNEGYRNVLLSVSNPGARGLVMSVESPTAEPIRPLSEYGQKVTRLRQRGLTYPYEIVRMLTPGDEATRSDVPPGSFREHDLDVAGRLVPVDRPYGKNAANVVVGVVSNRTLRYPDGMTRVVLLGDPSRDMGALAEPECRRILAALDLAASQGVPLDWFALSAGARIAMDTGTENMDWISRVLRRIVEFTQAGGEVNVVVCGVNVGAQPYWNAEATMLMHTKGILVMVPEAAMVLTGKTALDYSGSVSAEDNTGIGGYERVMGPNGQAQYWAQDLFEACRLLLAHHEHAYVAPGERFPRRAPTSDPRARDVRPSAHAGNGGLETVGDVFSDAANPGRKRPFDVRSVMAAVVDRDHAPLERWAGMRDAETAVVWDAHLGGYSVCLIGLESKPLPRLGFVPTDGPQEWTAGTLFPKSSKKVARAINAASGSRPLVLLANLSGFDGSPESMRRHQLEYGAEIGRAIVNFRGPIVFCVISRYHGGAFVVFSKALNEGLEAAALEGSHASVIGGPPAAAVVFGREVDARARRDPRVAALEAELAAAEDAGKRRLRAKLDEVVAAVRSEKLGEVAEEFDRIHSVGRALAVGSLDRILPAAELRPYLIDAVERGMRAFQPAAGAAGEVALAASASPR